MATAKLLPELADEVLQHHTDLYAQDPAMQWTHCRHISAREKRRIEKHFEQFWLKKLVVTINHGPWDQLDYQQLRPRPKEDSPEAYGANEIRFDLNSDVRDKTDLVQLWKDTLENPGIVILRLGENYLNRGLKSAYIVNDSGLPGLKVSGNGRFITFDWIKTFDHLLREEIMLRKTRARLVSRQHISIDGYETNDQATSSRRHCKSKPLRNPMGTMNLPGTISSEYSKRKSKWPTASKCTNIACVGRTPAASPGPGSKSTRDTTTSSRRRTSAMRPSAAAAPAARAAPRPTSSRSSARRRAWCRCCPGGSSSRGKSSGTPTPRRSRGRASYARAAR